MGSVVLMTLQQQQFAKSTRQLENELCLSAETFVLLAPSYRIETSTGKLVSGAVKEPEKEREKKGH